MTEAILVFFLFAAAACSLCRLCHGIVACALPLPLCRRAVLPISRIFLRVPYIIARRLIVQRISAAVRACRISAVLLPDVLRKLMGKRAPCIAARIVIILLILQNRHAGRRVLPRQAIIRIAQRISKLLRAPTHILIRIRANPFLIHSVFLRFTV